MELFGISDFRMDFRIKCVVFHLSQPKICFFQHFSSPSHVFSFRQFPTNAFYLSNFLFISPILPDFQYIFSSHKIFICYCLPQAQSSRVIKKKQCGVIFVGNCLRLFSSENVNRADSIYIRFGVKLNNGFSKQAQTLVGSN